jgi:phage terminase large subunit-like protein
MEGYTYFFTYEEILTHPRRDFWGMPCSMGGDMSQGDDFCAFDFLFPLGGYEFGLKCRSYITERTLFLLPSATRQKYNEFIEEGSLIVMDGAVLDMMQVYDDLDRYIIDSQYDVRAFGFDPYNAKEFVERWEQENGPVGIEKVIQGAKTESVPLGELKTLTEDRKIIFDQELMSFCMGNAITMEDTNGNRKLMKRRRENKIDNVAAMLDAYVAWKLNRDQFE